jgi:hypothetical protein
MCFNFYQTIGCYRTASVVWWSEFLATQRRCIVFPVRYELNLYKLWRRPPLWSSGQSKVRLVRRADNLTAAICEPIV